MEERTRTNADRIISALNSARYALTEPITLRLLREWHKPEFVVPEKEPLISVYIPTYNRAELLMSRAIPSVLKQTYKNFELIVIGDCCTDETEVEVLSLLDNRVKFYNLRKHGGGYPLDAKGRWFAGPVAAANAALSVVKGSWIARIDDDDEWKEDHLEKSLRFAQRNDLEFVSSLVETKRFGKKGIAKPYNLGNAKVGGTQTWLYRNYLKHFRYNINCWRKSWNAVNDADIQQRFYDAGVRMGHISRVHAFTYPRPGETTIGLDQYRLAEQKGFKKYYGD